MSAKNELRKILNQKVGIASLASKWMPRKGKEAVELTKFLKLTPKEYRRLIVGLTKVVETQMCAKQWDNIEFSHVPSLASARYQKAFSRNAPEKYTAYMNELSKPESERDPSVKINAGAVYPYDVVKSVYSGVAQVADAQWEALPNYVGDASIFPMIDVSGSMGDIGMQNGRPTPMLCSVSLGLYLSEKNTGAFKDLFLTFSEKPEIVHLKGTLSERVHGLAAMDSGLNTNLQSAFEEILRVAKQGNVAAEDMPKILIILSDMQFDAATTQYQYSWGPAWQTAETDKTPKRGERAIEMAQRLYEESGYELPKVVFWNLYDYGNTPVRYDEQGTAHVSGFSPALMKAVLANDLEDFTPMSVMLGTIMDHRYDL